MVYIACSDSLTAALMARTDDLMSFTCAGLLPRMLWIKSSKSAKRTSSPHRSSKIVCPISAKATTSVPAWLTTRANSPSATSFSMSFSLNTCSWMLYPRPVRTSCKSVANAITWIPSFSVDEIALTTSTNTPINMFISSTEATMTNDSSTGQSSPTSFVASRKSLECFGRTPSSINTWMLPGTDENHSTLSPAIILTKSA
mmetsp:Transcript_11493/g.28545  ORF Transcript_11493/g.28545 Transcript_11493/m.28545 type:complete len:200 (+) Transcript_11493:126-725(+)